MAEQFIFDGTSDFSLGQDSWHAPDRIRDNQFYRGVNVTTKRGILSPRPGFWDRTITFEDGTVTNDYGYKITYSELWHGGKFQAAVPVVNSNDEYIVTVVGGLIFRINVNSQRGFLLSKTIKLNQYASRINWAYAAGKIVFFDYPDYPVVVDDTNVFRCDPNHIVNGAPAPQVPISCFGCYNQNRLFVGNAGVEFTAGDPVGSLSTPEAPITFTEVYTPSGPFFNQVFSLPVDEAIYPVTAMGFIQQIDSNTGIGPMFIATSKKIYDCHTDQPRTNWGQTTGFVNCILANAGIAGPRAFVNVNSDIISMNAEGKIHAMSTSRNDTQRWGDVPISREVDNFLKFSDPLLSRYAVLGYFDNHVYISANPYRVQAQDRSQRPVTDYAHGGFVVLEIDQIASMLEPGTPVWAGIWTGVNPMEFVNIGSRAFVLSKDGCGFSGVNRLYEVMPDETYDMVGGVKREVRSIVDFKEWNFKQPFSHKRENSLNLHIRNIKGDVDLKIEKKTSDSNHFIEYGSWKHKAASELCFEFPPDDLLNGIAPHQIRELVFGDSKENGCNPVNGDSQQIYCALQLRMTIQAEYWELREIKIQAEPVPFEERQDIELCSTARDIKIPVQCEPYWLIPELPICENPLTYADNN